MNNWGRDPRPGPVRDVIATRWPHLDPQVQKALAVTVVRMIHYRRRGVAPVAPDHAIEAVAPDLMTWCSLARCALDLAEEAAPLDDPGDYAPSAHEPQGKPRVTRTREEMVHGLRKMADELGRTPTVAEIEENPDLPTVSVYWYHFGGLAKAMRMAGVEPRTSGSRPSWSSEDLLRFLLQRCQALGGAPSQAFWDARRGEGPSAATYRSRFGSWGGALKAVGLPARRNGDPPLLRLRMPRAGK